MDKKVILGIVAVAGIAIAGGIQMFATPVVGTNGEINLPGGLKWLSYLSGAAALVSLIMLWKASRS